MSVSVVFSVGLGPLVVSQSAFIAIVRDYLHHKTVTKNTEYINLFNLKRD